MTPNQDVGTMDKCRVRERKRFTFRSEGGCPEVVDPVPASPRQQTHSPPTFLITNHQQPPTTDHTITITITITYYPYLPSPTSLAGPLLPLAAHLVCLLTSDMYV